MKNLFILHSLSELADLLAHWLSTEDTVVNQHGLLLPKNLTFSSR
jgi:hypothetical protein